MFCLYHFWAWIQSVSQTTIYLEYKWPTWQSRLKFKPILIHLFAGYAKHTQGNAPSLYEINPIPIIFYEFPNKQDLTQSNHAQNSDETKLQQIALY